MKIMKISGIILGLSCFLISCKERPSSKLDDKEGEASGTRHKSREDTRANSKTGKNSEDLGKLVGLRGENLQSEFSLLLAGGASRMDLFQFAMNEAPEVSRNTLLSLLGESAGESGDLDMAEEFLKMNPGNQRETALIAFAREIRNSGDILEFIDVFSKHAFPEEVAHITQALAHPVSSMDFESVNYLINSKGVPPEISQLLAINYGRMLVDLGPDAAQLHLGKLPVESASVATESYWTTFALKDVNLAKDKWRSEVIPDEHRLAVGKKIIDAIARDSNRNDAINFAAESSDPDTCQSLSQYVFGQWVRQDSIAASEFASKLPSGNQRDGAAEAIAVYLENKGAKKEAEQWRASKTLSK